MLVYTFNNFTDIRELFFLCILHDFISVDEGSDKEVRHSNP